MGMNLEEIVEIDEVLVLTETKLSNKNKSAVCTDSIGCVSMILKAFALFLKVKFWVKHDKQKLWPHALFIF